MARSGDKYRSGVVCKTSAITLLEKVKTVISLPYEHLITATTTTKHAFTLATPIKHT